jgi:hypothetical protein
VAEPAVETLRCVADKLLRILIAMLKQRSLYDPSRLIAKAA